MIWDELKHLKRSGNLWNWGDASKIDPQLLRMVDDLESHLNLALIVTSGYRDGDKGFHGEGLALDIMCPSLNLVDFWIAAERYRFTGLGLYPHWVLNGKQVSGIHVDIRPLGGLMRAARWLAYRDTDGKQVYTTLSRLNLVKYNII